MRTHAAALPARLGRQGLALDEADCPKHLALNGRANRTQRSRPPALGCVRENGGTEVRVPGCDEDADLRDQRRA